MQFFEGWPIVTRGPKPKPTALKLLAGNPGKRAINRDEPRPETGMGSCPSWLPKAAKAEWGRVVPELERLGMLAKVDRAALIAFCQAVALTEDAQRMLDEHGILVPGAQGGFVKNPAATVVKEAAATIRGFAGEFGLTPSARSRLVVPRGDSNDAERLLS